MSTLPYSDTQRRLAKTLKKLAEDELGARPSHRLCLELVRDAGLVPGESREVKAARLFEANRELLRQSGKRRQP